MDTYLLHKGVRVCPTTDSTVCGHTILTQIKREGRGIKGQGAKLKSPFPQVL